MSDAKNKVNNRSLSILNKRLSEFDKYKDKSKMGDARLKRFKELQAQKQAILRQKETGITSDPRITKEIKEKKGPIVKGPIVTKEELAASGLSLRDYLNKKQGKTRRHGDTLVKGTVVSNYKTDGKKDRNMGVVKTASASNNVNKKKVPMYSNDTANKKKISQVDSFSKSKVKQGPPPPPAKQKKPGFLDRIKSGFNKAVSETKRNFQGDAKKKTGRYKSVNEKNLDSKGNYKGTNIKPTKLQLSRMKKPEKNTMDFGAKKKKASAPMYESKGTMGLVKKSKYYSGGGTVFTGR